MPSAPERPRIESWSILETALLWAYEGPFTPAMHVAPAFTNPFYAFCLRRGEVALEGKSGREVFGAKQWVFPRAEPGLLRFSGDADLLAVRFNLKWPNEVSLFDRSQTVAFPLEASKRLTAAAQRLCSYIRQRRLLTHTSSGAPRLLGDLGDSIRLRLLFDAWIDAYYTLFTRSGRQPERFGPLSERMRIWLRYLRHRSPSRPFYEKELAEIEGVSISQVCKIFVQEIGITPQSFWNARRLRTARLELLQTDRSVKEIAFFLGFSSPEHFARWFRRNAGVAPRSFRHHEHPELE